MSETPLRVSTDDFRVVVDRDDETGSLNVAVNSDPCGTDSLIVIVNDKIAVRLGDLYIAAKDLIDPDTPSTPLTREYARGMAELIGYFAPTGSPYDSEHMRQALVPSAVPTEPGYYEDRNGAIWFLDGNGMWFQQRRNTLRASGEPSGLNWPMTPGVTPIWD